MNAYCSDTNPPPSSPRPKKEKPDLLDALDAVVSAAERQRLPEPSGPPVVRSSILSNDTAADFYKGRRLR